MKNFFQYSLTLMLLVLAAASHARSVEAISATEYSERRLLLGGTDYVVRVGAKSVYYGTDTGRQTLDILAELTWKACLNAGELTQETVAWLAKALGSSRNVRYANVLDHCLSSISNDKTKKHVSKARAEIARADVKGMTIKPFRRGALDLKEIKKALFKMEFAASRKNLAAFKKLAPGQKLENVFSQFGAPDSIKVTNVRAEKADPGLPKAAMRDRMVLRYNGLGKIYFFFGKKARQWMLEYAESGSRR